MIDRITKEWVQEQLFAQQARVMMVVVDDSPEFKVALHYTCLRAKRTNSKIALLYAIEPDIYQLSLSLEALATFEKRQEAEDTLSRYATLINQIYGLTPIFYIKEGDRLDVIIDLLLEDESISILVLGSSVEKSGPGPLISGLFERHSQIKIPIPITIVPGSLSSDDLKGLI